jgi:hypothetical protein
MIASSDSGAAPPTERKKLTAAEDDVKILTDAGYKQDLVRPLLLLLPPALATTCAQPQNHD